MRAVLLFLLVLLWVPASQAEDFANNLFKLNLPDGFKGPIQKSQDGGSIFAFVKPHPGSNTASLIQISIYDFGPSFAKIPNAQLSNAAEKYLREALQGVQRRRTNFHTGESEDIRISGIPGRKISWSCTVQGEDLTAKGVMFSVLKGSKVFSIHVQDSAEFSSQTFPAAVKAIEGMEIR